MTRQLRLLIPVAIVVTITVVVLSLNPFALGGFSRGGTGSPLGFTLGLDLEGGAHLVYEIQPAEEGDAVTEEDAEALRDVVSQRVNSFGVSEPVVQLLGEDQLLVQIPGQATEPRIQVAFSSAQVDPLNSLQLPTQSDVLEQAQAAFGDSGGLISVETLDAGGQQLVYEVNFAQSETTGARTLLGDGEALRERLEAEFPVVFEVFFEIPPPSTETVDTVVPEVPEVPSTETGTMMTVDPGLGLGLDLGTGDSEEGAVITSGELFNLFAAAGRSDVAVGPPQEGTITNTGVFAPVMDTFTQPTVLLFTVTGRGGLTEDSFASDGTRTPGDADLILDQLRDVEEFQFFGVSGQILNYSATGGIEQAKQLIGSTALLSFTERTCGSALPPPDAEEWPPDGLSEIEWQQARCINPRYFMERATEIDSADLVSANAGTQEGQLGPVINIQFNDEGAQAFFDVTSRISQSGDRLAIRLDGNELIAPGASTPIAGGRAFITGEFTATGDIATAERIAIQLQSGALPATLELIQERTVDATLGSDSLDRSLIAAGVGLALLALFLILYYKVPGVVATVTLVLYAVALLAVIKLIPITLTLSGIAAMILSFGFAVDANVLVAERIKEEIKSGKNVFAAISNGFARAWPSIRDGNLSTLIIALVLFWFGDRFGTSLIQGFALTLGVGLFLSMFFAYLVNRILIRLVAHSPLGRRVNMFIPVYISAESALLDAGEVEVEAEDAAPALGEAKEAKKEDGGDGA